MKKALIAASALALPVFASAQDLSGVETLVRSVSKIVDLLIPIVFALAMLFFFWGLAQYILASGDSGKQEEGRNKMIWGIVALFVMSAVWGLVRWIGNSLDVTVGGGAQFKPGDLVPKN
jgi:TM2 domain-containing membrane protein YozV